MRVRAIAVLSSLSLFFSVTRAQTQAPDYSACEQMVTNENQLAGVFTCDVLCIPSTPPDFPAWLIDPQFLWADFAALPSEFSAAFAQSQEQVHGVTVLKLKLTRWILTGETTVELPSSTSSVTLAAPAGYQASEQHDWATRSALTDWQQWIDWGELDATTAPTLRMNVALADVQDKPAYDAMLEAEDAACVEASAAESLGSMEMLDSEDLGGDSLLLLSQDGTPCGASKFNRLQVQATNFFLEWFSITNATYEIASVTDMTIPGSNWTSVASLYPAAAGTNLTSFLDVAGATNKVKFYKVAKTGISILLCDSNTFGGVVEILVEIGLPPGKELAGVNFLMDGQPSMSILDPDIPFGSTSSAHWSTLYVSNGWHTLQAFASYPDSGQSEAGGYSQYSSQIVTVQTVNAIIFPDFPTTFGTALPITALLSSSNASWTVTIFSPSNSLLRTYSGSTSTGRIDVVWDGNDTNGVSFGGDFVDVQVSTVPSGGFAAEEAGEDPSAKIRVHKRPVGGYPSGFLVTYENAAVQQRSAEEGFQAMLSQVDDSLVGGPYDLIGPNSIDNNTNSWAAWKTSLSDSSTANLYHFGHGSWKDLGVNPKAHLGFYVKEIQAYLTNTTEAGFLGFGHTLVTKHPYRFVFLDGCNTADGDWCVAFGVDRKKTSAAQFAQKGVEPQAFMGWVTIKVYIEGHGLFDPDHYNFVVNFFNRWIGDNLPLSQAISQSLPAAFTAPRVWGDDQITGNP